MSNVLKPKGFLKRLFNKLWKTKFFRIPLLGIIAFSVIGIIGKITFQNQSFFDAIKSFITNKEGFFILIQLVVIATLTYFYPSYIKARFYKNLERQGLIIKDLTADKINEIKMISSRWICAVVCLTFFFIANMSYLLGI
jgi:hypothetical protein